jgi:hypothetical protein
MPASFWRCPQRFVSIKIKKTKWEADMKIKRKIDILTAALGKPVRWAPEGLSRQI